MRSSNWWCTLARTLIESFFMCAALSKNVDTFAKFRMGPVTVKAKKYQRLLWLVITDLP
ncbi:hypothetical protein [Cyanobium sp. ATX-6F1]|uniref:hypothetical protein n=1 Tax=Cyanobium sp. ATX-6F1 TaxID=3137388 RepID=UPI0039BDB47C